MASPWPPPPQSAAPPICRRRGCRALIRVTTMRAPVAPSGWPSATAPPWRLTFSWREVEQTRRPQRHGGEGLVDSTRSRSCGLSPAPGQGERQRLSGPVVQWWRRARRSGRTRRIWPRRQPGGLGFGAIGDHQGGGAVGDLRGVAGGDGPVLGRKAGVDARAAAAVESGRMPSSAVNDHRVALALRHRHRGDLGVEGPGRGGGGRLLVALRRPLVLLGAPDAQLGVAPVRGGRPSGSCRRRRTGRRTP